MVLDKSNGADSQVVRCQTHERQFVIDASTEWLVGNNSLGVLKKWCVLGKENVTVRQCYRRYLRVLLAFRQRLLEDNCSIPNVMHKRNCLSLSLSLYIYYSNVNSFRNSSKWIYNCPSSIRLFHQAACVNSIIPSGKSHLRAFTEARVCMCKEIKQIKGRV